MQYLRFVVVAAWGACTFNPGVAIDAADPGPAVDAPLEAIQMCTPGAKLCRGRDLEVCNAAGTDLDPTKKQSCGLGCLDDDRCVEASNIPRMMQTSCTASARKLQPAAGATVRISDSQITCSSSCDGTAGGALTIQPVDIFEPPQGPDLAVYCLGGVTIPATVTVSVDPGIDEAIGWFVAGNVQIDGVIDVGGGTASDAAAGAAGPAGGAGGGRAAENQPGRAGAPASCGGRGGSIAATPTNPATAIGGGGGGGSHAGKGGDGGRGRQSGGTTANGGASGAVCGTDALVPLTGGGGGGGGSDASCGTACGWAGGGGGGALQISATGTISISADGSIRAAGGAGHGSDDNVLRRAGGGGGGAGGAVLLEALNLALAGTIRVTGGPGGNSGAGAGGPGASTGLTGGDGTDENANEEGGAGGGGGAGRVRVNAVGATCPATVAPAAACTMGPLRPTPMLMLHPSPLQP